MSTEPATPAQYVLYAQDQDGEKWYLTGKTGTNWLSLNPAEGHLYDDTKFVGCAAAALNENMPANDLNLVSFNWEAYTADLVDTVAVVAEEPVRNIILPLPNPHPHMRYNLCWVRPNTATRYEIQNSTLDAVERYAHEFLRRSECVRGIPIDEVVLILEPKHQKKRNLTDYWRFKCTGYGKHEWDALTYDPFAHDLNRVEPNAGPPCSTYSVRVTEEMQHLVVIRDGLTGERVSLTVRTQSDFNQLTEIFERCSVQEEDA